HEDERDERHEEDACHVQMAGEELSEHRAREPEQVAADERRPQRAGQAAAEQVCRPGGERREEQRGGVVRDRRSEQHRHRREEERQAGTRRRPGEVDAGRRVDDVGDERVRPGADRVRPPGERPDEDRVVAGLSDDEPAGVGEQAPAEVGGRERGVGDQHEQVRLRPSQHAPMLVLPVGRRGRARDAARRLPAVPRLSARPGPVVTTLGRVVPTGQAVIAWVARRELPVLGLWAALAIVLAAITTRVADWFVMTNELLYERRAIASAQTLSPLPQIRGTVIQSFDQLYPLLIAPVFRYGLVPGDLIQAHFLNAWIMSSACIPVFLLARRVTGRAWAAYAAAFLAVTIPWIMYSS